MKKLFRQKMHNKILILLLVVIFIIAIFCFASYGGMAYADENTAEDELNTNIEEILSNLNLTELEEYYQTLNDKQKGFFGTSIFDYVKNIVTGEFNFSYSGFVGYLFGAIGVSLTSMLPMLISIIAISILISIISGLKGSFSSNSVQSIVNLAGIGLTAITVLLQVFTVIKDTAALISSVKTQIECVFPILFTLMTAIGASSSITVYQPAVAILTVSITELMTVIIMPLILINIVFSVIGNLSDAVRLKNMSKFIGSLSKWLLYTSFFLFIAFLSVQGITASIYDNISIRTTKFAVSNYIPIIGGYLSEGFNLIAAGSVLIKNSVGLTSIILLIITVLPTFLNIVLLSLALKLSAALIEPFSNDKITGMLGSISNAVNMLISVIAGIVFMYFLFILLIIISGNLAF